MREHVPGSWQLSTNWNVVDLLEQVIKIVWHGLDAEVITASLVTFSLHDWFDDARKVWISNAVMESYQNLFRYS